MEKKTAKLESRSRRRLLHAISTGGAAVAAHKILPEKWTKPIIDSVILPAHAQPSIGRANGIFTNQPAPGMAAVERPSAPGTPVWDRISNFFIKSAYAGVGTCDNLVDTDAICVAYQIDPSPANTVSIYVDGDMDSTYIYPNNYISIQHVDNSAPQHIPARLSVRSHREVGR